MNLIDIFSIMPFYIEKLMAGSGGSLSVLRMLRMARIFRIFKVGSYASDLQLFAVGMSKASSGLALLSFMLLIYVTVFGAFIEMAENGP
eukprot:SAG22_NODE_8049_length_687_cov_1.290816_2_plen_88_part_01